MKRLLLPFILALAFCMIGCGEEDPTEILDNDPTALLGSITFTFESTDYSFTKGFTDFSQLGSPPLASQDEDVTNMYAMETAIAFANILSISNAIFLTNINLIAVGTGTASAIYYDDAGTPTMEQVNVTITEYGTTGNLVTGTFEGTEITNGVFSVYNLSEE